MDEYEVGTAPDQIVRWLKAELRTGRRPFEVRASRMFADADLDRSEAERISDDTDIGSITAVGTLEVRPMHEPKGWILQVRAEDALGDHLPEDHSATVEPEDIDLEDFEAVFITPMQANVDVVLFAETQDAKRAFDQILLDITRDKHAG